MDKLRVVLLDTERVWRGGQQQLFTLMVGLQRRGHRVVFAGPARAPLSQRAAEAGIHTIPYRQRMEASASAWFRLHQKLREARPEILHHNTPRTMVAGALASWGKGRPVRVVSRRVNFALRGPLSRFKYNRLVDGIATVSESIRETLIHQGVHPEKITVVHEGVDLADFDALAPAPPLNHFPGPVIATVAHLSAEKGHDTLLEAFALVIRDFPDATLAIVGDGILRAALEEQAERLGITQSVFFAGFRDDVDRLWGQFDLFCLASLSEGLSSSILAAMAASLPVVATRVGGNPELVEEGVNGSLVPVSDPQALGQALRDLLGDGARRREMGRASRRRIETHFTMTAKIDKTIRWYRQLIGERRIG